MSKEKTVVKLGDIINQIIKFYGWDDVEAQEAPDKVVDTENKRRWLRDRYDFIWEHILLKEKRKFKENPNVSNSKNLIPEADAPIVTELLIRSVLEDKDNLFVKWFNENYNNINVNDVETTSQIIELCNEIEIMMKELQDKDCFIGLDLPFHHIPDSSVCTSWEEAIKTSLNYDFIIHIQSSKDKLKKMYHSISTLKPMISFSNEGRRFADMNRVFRKYYVTGESSLFNPTSISITRSDEPFSAILEKCYTQEDFFNILLQVVDAIDTAAKKKTIQGIIGHLKEKELHTYRKITDKDTDIQSGDTIALGNYIWSQNVYLTLKIDHEFLSILIEKMNEDEDVKKLRKGQPLTEAEVLEYFHVGK